MRNIEVHFSSEKKDWGTPPELFNFLDEIFKFTIDGMATDETAMCCEFVSPEENFLKHEMHGENIFMNPEYGRNIGLYVSRLRDLCIDNNTGVALVPARTETKWFQTCWQAEALIFLRGRLKFVGAKSSAPFPSVLALFGRVLSKHEVEKLETIGKVIIP